VSQLKFTIVSVGSFWINFNAKAVRPHNKINVKNIILFTGNLSTINPHKGLTIRDKIDKNVKMEPTIIGE
jgi:hypothetical protein